MAIATPLSTSGRFIVDAHGNRVRLAGVNWYGASEDLGVPVGLDTVHRDQLAQLIAGFGFNSVRFPFSAWMTEQTAPVPDQYLAANPDLSGSTPIQVYDACVEALTGAGLMVIPNCHLLDFGWCCADQDDNGLWFNDRWTAATFTATWQGIVKRYASNPLVVAMDVKNEPRPATVGGQPPQPDVGARRPDRFRRHVHRRSATSSTQLNPHLLIICEGLGYATHLEGVASHPVKLAQANKVVYSMHDYSWFHAQGQTAGRLRRGDEHGRRVRPQPRRSPRSGSASSATRVSTLAVFGQPQLVGQHPGVAHRRGRRLVLVGAQPHARQGFQSRDQHDQVQLGPARAVRPAGPGLD